MHKLKKHHFKSLIIGILQCLENLNYAHPGNLFINEMIHLKNLTLAKMSKSVNFIPMKLNPTTVAEISVKCIVYKKQF